MDDRYWLNEYVVRDGKITTIPKHDYYWDRSCYLKSRKKAEKELARYLAKTNLEYWCKRIVDEHGSLPHKVIYLDYLDARKSKKAPYYDTGKKGLGFVEGSVTTRYRGNWKGWSSTRRTRYLIGRNESGTFFSHAVSLKCKNVREAIDWIWNGKADDILRRQGDVAVIRTSSNRIDKGLSKLPDGHVVDGDQIVHKTHPPITVPGKNERLIVGRRAFDRVKSGTRD